MTTNDIDAIRKLTDAATKGPWTTGADKEWADALPPWALIPNANYPLIELEEGPQGTADAEFIAAARTLVPALCDEIEQLRAAHDSAVTAIAESESDIDDRDSEISTLKQDLDFQTKAAWDNRSEIARLTAELEKVRGQLTDTRHRADGYANDLRSLQHGHDTYANENAELRKVAEAVDSLLAVTDGDPLGDHGVAIALSEIRRVVGEAREGATR